MKRAQSHHHVHGPQDVATRRRCVEGTALVHSGVEFGTVTCPHRLIVKDVARIEHRR